VNRNDRRSDADIGMKAPTVVAVGPARIPAPTDDRSGWIYGPVQSIARTGDEGTPHRGPDERFEPLLDSPAAAKLLGIHPKTLQKLARIGRVPAHSVCGLWRFRASELDDWLKTAISSKSHSRSN
jgi:excisionase family DNA binding protein